MSRPERHLLDINTNRPDRFQLVQDIVQSFWWSRWHKEYLKTLLLRIKWNATGPIFSIRDLVLLCEDNVPPLRWPMARILELYPGFDCVSCVAKIKTSSGHFKRPIVKLRLLPSVCGNLVGVSLVGGMLQMIFVLYVVCIFHFRLTLPQVDVFLILNFKSHTQLC